MVRTLFNNYVFIYILLALAAVGILMKLTVQILYSRLLRASESMGTSKNKLAQNMKKKFEAYYKLKLGVNNVDIFVDKHFFHYKFSGIFLSTWENLCGQVLVLSLLTGAIGTILGLIYECGKNQILSTFSVGILTCGLLIFLEGAVNPTGKKEMIRINMKDYLENILKARLVQEEQQPELMEQYKKACQPSAYLAAAHEPDKKETSRVTAKKKKVKSREAKRLEKMSLKARKKDEAVKKKGNKKLLKAQNKTVLLEQKNAVKERKKNSIIEKKLYARRIKEAKAAEIAGLKAKKQEEELQRQREKLNQEEIKKALKLEKKAVKDDSKTVAQKKKETLLREIQDRRKPGEGSEAYKLEDIGLTSAVLSKEDKRAELTASSKLQDGKLVDFKGLENKGSESKKPEIKITENGLAEHKPVVREAAEGKSSGYKVMAGKETESKTSSRTAEYNATAFNKVQHNPVGYNSAKYKQVENVKVPQVVTTTPTSAQIKEVQVQAADIHPAEINIVTAKAITFDTELDILDNKTAAALEDGRSRNQKVNQVFRPTTEEEEKIINDILKDIFA